jgi:hypothetical protein
VVNGGVNGAMKASAKSVGRLLACRCGQFTKNSPPGNHAGRPGWPTGHAVALHLPRDIQRRHGSISAALIVGVDKRGKPIDFAVSQ